MMAYLRFWIYSYRLHAAKAYRRVRVLLFCRHGDHDIRYQGFWRTHTIAPHIFSSQGFKAQQILDGKCHHCGSASRIIYDCRSGETQYETEVSWK